MGGRQTPSWGLNQAPRNCREGTQEGPPRPTYTHPGHSPTLASCEALPGHQHTSSTVEPCPLSVCCGARRVPVPAAVPAALPGGWLARLVACEARSHTSTCTRGDDGFEAGA